MRENDPELDTTIINLTATSVEDSHEYDVNAEQENAVLNANYMMI